MDPATRPIAVELDRARALRIRWADGRVSDFPLADLRRACPCASCRTERESAGSPGNLPIVAAPAMQAAMAGAESVELVGHYGLRVRWRDGHDAGIYEFAQLRSLSDESGRPREP